MESRPKSIRFIVYSNIEIVIFMLIGIFMVVYLSDGMSLESNY